MTVKTKDTYVDTYRVLKCNRKVQPKPLNNFTRFIAYVKFQNLTEFACRRLISIFLEILEMRTRRDLLKE